MSNHGRMSIARHLSIANQSDRATPWSAPRGLFMDRSRKFDGVMKAGERNRFGAALRLSEHTHEQALFSSDEYCSR